MWEIEMLHEPKKKVKPTCTSSFHYNDHYLELRYVILSVEQLAFETLIHIPGAELKIETKKLLPAQYTTTVYPSSKCSSSSSSLPFGATAKKSDKITFGGQETCQLTGRREPLAILLLQERASMLWSISPKQEEEEEERALLGIVPTVSPTKIDKR